ncbi:hypothetical protein L3D22_07240 [Lysobacter soli]|uniref:hypothetical protein n=1 Tax=Lysobacter TaxID=68 RepID=UPI00178A7195|nr:hypothetical protein [Lysobacter soli]UTA55589.1 hypothetical protein L3D22_07240 [Lysobacter soli]
MSTRHNAADDAISPVAVPHWPGVRHVDLIERSLRGLSGASREALLDAVARTLDRYVSGTTRRVGYACLDLDVELDEVLRRLGPPRSSALAGAIA